MKAVPVVLVTLLLAALLAAVHAGDAPPIDIERGKQLMRRFQAGETLTAEEQAYLDRVRQEIQKGRGRPGAPSPGKGAAPNGPAKIAAVAQNLVPLTELTAAYQGEDGGLYGGGHNAPPDAHRAAYLKESEKIRPLDADGRPAKDGKIGLVTIGFSNTSLESADFKKTADADPQKSPGVVIVNGAIGMRSAVMWAYDGSEWLPKPEQERLDKAMDQANMPKTNRKGPPGAPAKDTWPILDQRLKTAGLSPKQVQAAWLKQVEAGPGRFGNFPAHAKALEADMADILIIAKQRFPNLCVVFLSSRTFAGWSASGGGSPEPFAYECAFAVRWLIQSQIAGDARLNYDPARGAVNAPLVIWGPYLWTRGDAPRKLDGMIWTIDDVVTRDRIHPSESGCKKVTALLLNMLKTDEAARRWYLAPGAGDVVPLRVDSHGVLPAKPPAKIPGKIGVRG